MFKKRMMLLLLALGACLLVLAPASAMKEKPDAQKRAVRFKHRFPTTMTLQEAAQYEQRGIPDQEVLAPEAEPEPSFVPVTGAGSLVPTEVKNYPIPPGAIYSGETTMDQQWYGGSHRTIQHGKDPADPGGPKTYVHVTWMSLKSYVLADPNRNVFYNCYDWTWPGWTVWQSDWGGMPIIEVGERGGFSHLDVNSSGNAVVFHHSDVGGATAYGRVTRFSIPGMGIYTADPLPNPVGQQSIWCRGAIGQTEAGPLVTADVYHVGGQDSNPWPDGPAWQSYWRFIAPFGPWEGPVPMSMTMVVGHELAANGERVIFAYAHPRDFGVSRNQYNNDLVYFESLNSGADWIAGGGFTVWDVVTGGAAYNVTSYVDSDPHRVFLDGSLMFDYDGRLHALFTTPGYNDAEGTISVGPTVMQHWDEGSPGSNENAQISNYPPIGFVGGTDMYHSVAAAAMWGAIYPNEANDGSSGAWNRYISKMTLGIGDGSTACYDPSTGNTNNGYLYACYTRFGGEYVEDKEDASASGYQDGNIYISMSNDNGFSWDAGRCLTTVDGSFDGTGIPTRSPGCDCPTTDPMDPECANPCRSEHWGSMAKTVNDTLHVFYICDYDAGGISNNEGNWSVNKAVYHAVIGEGSIDGVLCPRIGPVLSATLTGSPTCEYHGDLATGPGLSPYDVETLSIDNYGNDYLDFSVDIDYVSGSDWMTIDGGSSIPSTTIPKGGDTEEYDVVMDAQETYGKGLYQAIIQISHNDDARQDPFPIYVSFFVADSFVCGTGTIITTPTVALEVSNVSSWGRENGEGGMWYYNEPDDDSLYSPVFDGSLVIVNKTVTAAGPDTIAYRDIFTNQAPGNPGFRALEDLKLSYNAATDESVGVANQVTADSTIGITVQYIFPQHPDSCQFVRLKYRIYPNTFHDPDLIVGAAVDLDVGTTTLESSGFERLSNGDVGGYVTDYNLVYCQGTEQDTLIDYPDTVDVTTRYAAGISALSCGPAKRMVVQSNRNYVYPDGGFSDQYLYEEFDSNGWTIWYDMEDEPDGMDVVDDLHVLLAFPEITLTEDPASENGSHVFQMALVTSTQAEEDVDAFDYHWGYYNDYVLDLLDQTRKAWKKAFGWCGDFAINYGAGDYTVGPDGALYLNATGTHIDGLESMCCGCDFSLISVVPAPSQGTITLVDDGDCHAHLQFTDVDDWTYTITVSVSDMCGDQTEELTFEIDVLGSTCNCGALGDMNADGVAHPMDVNYLVKIVYQQMDCGVYPDGWNCPWALGDVNCGGSVDPLDVSMIVEFVYRDWDLLCDRCSTGK